MNQETFDDKTRMTTPEASASDGETQTLANQLSAPRRDAQAQLIGMVLHERYRIEKKLGDGGFGSVFLARDQRLMDKSVVVKILERSDNDWVWTKFQQEREALSRIEHPGVVGIQDAGELPDGQPYIVMQFVSGTTLRDALNTGTIPLSRIANITEQTAYALGAAHEQEILHRDLKPENIMLQPLAGEREQVKVIDFGIAKVKKSQVAESSTGLFSAGTLYYMPPESLQGKSYTAAGDVYVLAVLVYEMLTGARPFSPPTESPLLFASQLLDLQKSGAAELIRNIRPDLPNEARSILLKALSFDPSERFQDVIEFGSKFADAARQPQTFSQPAAQTVFSPPLAVQTAAPAISTTPLSEPTISLPKPPRTQKRKSFLLVGGLAAVVVLAMLGALVGFGVWFMNSSRQSTTGEQSAVTTNASQNSLRYWLNVQKMRDGKPFQEPFKSSGQEVFENGYKFQLNASSSQKGYLYFFNEGTGEQKDKFWILFPTPKSNGGLAEVKTNEQMQSGWNVFGGDAGTEKCWLIWTADENPVLEEARKNALDSRDGSLSGAQVERLKKFIADNRNLSKAPRKDASNQQMIAESNDKISVNLLELEHR
jgi:serine/threonine-protein kinase